MSSKAKFISWDSPFQGEILFFICFCVFHQKMAILLLIFLSQLFDIRKMVAACKQQLSGFEARHLPNIYSKVAIYATEWPTHSSPQKYTLKTFWNFRWNINKFYLVTEYFHKVLLKIVYIYRRLIIFTFL